ncbi:MAG: glycosyltransferase family 4 protein [Bacteroidales bacterium]|nr:glycosyltransferase family 4 protein [Bacteroidales bacterium]
MRILLLCDKPPWPGNSGGAIATRSVIDAMVANGFDLTIFFLSTPKHRLNSNDVPAGIDKQVSLIKEVTDNRINPIKALITLLFSRKPYNISRFYSKKTAGRISALLKESSFDVIQFEGLVMNLYFYHVKKESSAKLVMRSHNVESDIWYSLAGETHHPLRKFYYNSLAKRIERVEKESLNRYDTLLTISDIDRERFIDSGVTIPVITLYPALKKSATKDAVNLNGEIRAGFIGSLDWQPNIKGLIWFLDKVWPETKHSKNRIKLIVAGRNPVPLITRKMKRADVDYCGSPVSSSSFLEAINLLIVPLFSGSGIRIKIIEALMHGIPVVTTKRGAEGLPQDIAGMITITDDPSAMSAGIIETAYRGDSAQCSRLLIEKAAGYFSEEVATKKINTIYKALTGG